MIAKRVHVSGRVQGVGFRWSAAREAERLGVSGTVRNLADGRVEAVIAGDAAALERMLAWLHEGPSLAEVESVDVADADLAPSDAGADVGGAAGFRIL